MSNLLRIEDLVDDVIVATQERESYSALLRLGVRAQKIAANALTANDETLASLFLEARIAKNKYNSWMEW